MEKSYRIHTNIINDTVLNVSMQQDYDFLEVLSLKLRTADAYRLHSSNYGVVIGRVLANDAFGIPNARISVFVSRDTNDPSYMESIYPYTEVMDTDREGRRYNLLPDYSHDDCYRIVGTFPNKRLVLDDDVTLDIFDKYYKFTTVTNSAGDYMLFGVPSGSQQIHVDIDLSDIGILSQTPRDFEYKGYNMTMFDSPSQFKESSNLDGLAQIYSQNKSVFVYPFWGDANLGNGIAAITRCDVQMQYKFEPTCVFMGSIFSDNEGNSIGHKCAANVDNGMNDQLVTGEGTIEMIRKTTDGLIEEFSIQGNQLIDSNGVWCYQIPMNLDYVATDELGNIVPTDDPNKGIPTRTQVRFRFSKSETSEEGHSRHTAKYLVPMNPTLVGNKPRTAENGAYIEKMYTFGSNTPDDCFRDLYWNNVYSVKNYIPKVQVAHRAYAPNYTGLKGSNLAKDQNPIPFNKFRIDLPILYIIVCIIFGIVRTVVQIINIIISFVNVILNVFSILHNLCLDVGFFEICPFFFVPDICCIGCVSLGGGLSPDNTAYYPACDSRGMNASDCPDDMENCKKSANSGELMDLVQQKLAEDFKMVKLDFYQDWLNGSLYMPLWYWRKRKKKSFLFGLFTLRSAKNEYCSCDKTYSRLKSYVTCNIQYSDKELGVTDGSLPEGEDNWHRSKSRAGRIFFPYGLIKGVENKDGLTAYYYTAIQPTDAAGIMPMENRGTFEAFRLFATDIILLGNLNENNLYGLPQFFKSLPSTTANIPPIATVNEAADNSAGGAESENELASGEETGPSLVTGMDWIDGDGSPEYSDGLFFLLSCTYAHTKAKTCINVERLSEFGMNLDMRYDVTYPTSSGLRVGTFEHDGLITKYELDDMENRAMFATMNHLGFVPQTYQNTKGNFNVTQVIDENTNYYVPKFKYLYPTDLDGRMQPLIDRYLNGFRQKLTDERDKAYINFRLGDVQPNVNGGQFYYGNSMPLYNNSFYFYFGIKKGNTAIEKFNKMFQAQCFKNSKEPFTLDIKTRPMSYCLTNYKNDLGHSSIKVTSDDIQMPYTYQLVDANGIVQRKPEDELNTNSFEITDISNGNYTLIVTDDNGRHRDERINLELPDMSISYETRKLGTKYYDGTNGDTETPFTDICNNHDMFGKITFDKLFIDGYEFEIGSNTRLIGFDSANTSATVAVYARTISNNTSIFNIASGSGGTYVADLILKKNEENENVKECLCTNLDNNSFFINQVLAEKMSESEADRYISVFGFKVYKPDIYKVELYQRCNNVTISGNESTFSITIENGQNYYAYLNKMPVKFMLDKGTDFYPPSSSTENLKKWLNIHSETAYKFPDYSQKTIWKDFISNLTDKDLESYNKEKIIKFKFERLFNVAKGVYVTNNGGNKLSYTADGGVQPLLYRAFAPHYADTKNVKTNFLYSDNNYVTVDQRYPNIVGSNYEDGTTGSTKQDIRYNHLFSVRDKEHVGNYFMVASNNGRYLSDYEGDCNIYSQQIPTDAPVNLYDEWKKFGENTVVQRIPELVYNGGNALCQPNSKPYFKAMFVDRRLDYELSVLPGLVTVPDAIHFSNTETRLKTTSMRIVGTLYNGIEMGYDNNYNIISAKYTSGYTTGHGETEGEIIKIPNPSADTASADTTLEYTYKYNSANTVSEISATTVLNPPANKYYFKNYGDNAHKLICDKITHEWSGNTDLGVYNPESADTPVLKTYYAANVDNVDFRQLLWSNGSEKYLLNIAINAKGVNINNWKEYDASSNTGETLPFYLYNHYCEDRDTSCTKLYNGLFSENNYPIKRYLDIGKLKAKNYVTINLESCSYDLSVEQDEKTNLITSHINAGNSSEINISFGSLVPSPRGDTEDYGHLIYICQGRNGKFDATMSIDSIGLGMNYKSMTYDNFDAYSHTCVFLNIDEVKELKEKEDDKAIYDCWAGKQPAWHFSINNEGRILENGGRDWFDEDTNKFNSSVFYSNYPYGKSDGDIWTTGRFTNGVFTYNGRPMTSDDGNLANFRFGLGEFIDEGHCEMYGSFQTDTKRNFNFGSNKFIVACGLRELVPSNLDNSSKKIYLYDFSEFYDCRRIKVHGIYKGPHEVEIELRISEDSENTAIRYKDIEKVGVGIHFEYDEECDYGWHNWIAYFNDKDDIVEWKRDNDNNEIVLIMHGYTNEQSSMVDFRWYITMANGIIYKLIVNTAF